MKPVTRWVLVILVIVAIAVLFVLWSRRDKAPTEGEVAEQQPPAPPAAPVAPKVGPITASVLFDFDRSVIRAGETTNLDELATRFRGQGFDRVEAIGHADRIGTQPYNLRLSQQRAEAVSAYLAGKGVAAGSIRTAAKGESESATGDTCRTMGAERRANRKLVECLQPDRRVQLTLVPKP